MNFNKRVECHSLEQALAHNKLSDDTRIVAELMLNVLSEQTESVSSTFENEMVDEPTEDQNESVIPICSRDATKIDESMPGTAIVLSVLSVKRMPLTDVDQTTLPEG